MRIGTELDNQWLRHRIWELTEGRLTVEVREGTLESVRLLVLTTHEAIEPIRHKGRIRWRVDDNCVDVDATAWHSGRLRRTGVDWSSQPSGHRPRCSCCGDRDRSAVPLGRSHVRR
jgi:ATP-dependent DNA helicase RecG